MFDAERGNGSRRSFFHEDFSILSLLVFCGDGQGGCRIGFHQGLCQVLLRCLRSKIKLVGGLETSGLRPLVDDLSVCSLLVFYHFSQAYRLGEDLVRQLMLLEFQARDNIKVASKPCGGVQGLGSGQQVYNCGAFRRRL